MLQKIVRRNARQQTQISNCSSVISRPSRDSGNSHGSSGFANSQSTNNHYIMKLPEEQDMDDEDLEVVKKCLGLLEEEDEDEMAKFPSNLTHYTTGSSAMQATWRVCIFCKWLCEHPLFTSIFMLFTFYALFATDVDQLCGDKVSRNVSLILNTVVCAGFIIEIVVMSLGKDRYFLRPYFLLDAVALMSMLPETWIVQAIIDSDGGFVAGRSSRIARIIRVASRSSRTARMSRLIRVARVASLLPKINRFFEYRFTEQEVKTELSKRLNRVFKLFDDDMDGLVTKTKVTRFLDSVREQVIRHSCKAPTRMSESLSNVQAFKPARRALNVDDEDDGELSPKLSNAPSTPTFGGSEPAMPPSPKSVASSSSGSPRKIRNSQMHMIRDNNDDDDDTDAIGFQDFSSMLMDDRTVGGALRQAVNLKLRRLASTKNITAKHSEYVSVRVAIGVIILLILLGFADPSLKDQTLESGLEHLVEAMRLRFPNAASGDVVPQTMQSRIRQWLWNHEDDKRHQVLWLDILHLVYCDAFTYSESNCTTHVGATSYWGKRTDLKTVDNLIKDSSYRSGDIETIAVGRIRGSLDDDSLSDDERNYRTVGLAVINIRSTRQLEAAMSICSTVVIIIIILVGVALLTKDLSQLSSQLLKPLRELADDMESLTQLQLAGAEDNEVEDKKAQGTDEIRQIRHTFENMKKAIKSWGKYVPWPVVQMMLRANIEADLKVEEVEASMYFSDIAGFTTIVEQLAPEKSLQLLNRYFNDMTRVIDDHGGVVIEFIGDAILCIYGAPLANPYHPSAAVKGALRMLAALAKLNSWAVTKGLPEVSIRCGVHTGKVLVGNMGFQTRMKYGIVGEDSQLPSRLEELNKSYATNCLISRSTYVQLVDNMFLTRPVDYIRLRHAPGSEPEFIYQVMARERCTEKVHPLWEPAELHSEAMEMYLDKQFDEAIPKFQEARRLIMEHQRSDRDVAAELLIQRCEQYLIEPPPEDWDGVIAGG